MWGTRFGGATSDLGAGRGFECQQLSVIGHLWSVLGIPMLDAVRLASLPYLDAVDKANRRAAGKLHSWES
jgi:hypothetical protein